MTRRTLRAAAIQFQPEVGQVDANLDRCRNLVRQAISKGARCIMLPEFFTSGMTFDDTMLVAHRPLDGRPMQMLRELAEEGEAMIGGSFLAESDGHVFNGIVVADVPLEHTAPQRPPSDDFWIPELSPILRELWYRQGAVGREYYLRRTVAYRRQQSEDVQ